MAKVGDSTTSSSDGSTFMTVKSKEGYYVKGTVSELMLDQIKEGTELKCSTSNGDFNAKVAYVSEYPVSGDSSYYGSGNPNASYYEYTATIEDSSVKYQMTTGLRLCWQEMWSAMELFWTEHLSALKMESAMSTRMIMVC